MNGRLLALRSLITVSMSAGAQSASLAADNETPLVQLKTAFPHNFFEIAPLSSGKSHFQDSGPVGGAMVVMVHGVSGPLSIWDSLVPSLNQSGFRTLRYDLYGRGFSERLAQANYSLALYVRQLEDLLEQRGWKGPIHLVGSSFGCVIATEFALQHPQQVSSITLMGPAGFPITTPALAKLRDVPVLGDLLFSLAGKKTILEQNRKYFVSIQPPEPLWSYFSAQLEIPGTAESMAATMKNGSVQDYLASYEALGKHKIPVQVIWGEKDVTFPYANHDSLQAAVPTAKILSLPNTGHLPMVEAPQLTLKALTNHLANPPTSENNIPSTRQQWNVPLTTGITEAPPAAKDELFQTPFFSRFTATEASLPMSNGTSKQYKFPTFYQDVVTLQSYFTCDYDVALSYVDALDAKPVKIAPGRAVIVLSAYSYQKVRGLPAYNEVAIAIPVVAKNRLAPPLLPLTMSEFFHTAAAVIAMPVTSSENQLRGKYFWGLPKETLEIRMRQVNDRLSVEVSDHQGKLVLSHEGEIADQARVEESSTTLWTQLNKKSLAAVSTSIGSWHTKNSWSALANSTISNGNLTVGASEKALLLRSLKIGGTAFKTRVSLDVQTAFTLPKVRSVP